MKRELLWKIMAMIMVPTLPAEVLAKLPDDAQKNEIMNKAYRISVPFIENNGQINDKSVQLYAKTLGGTLFVEKDGVLTYSLPCEAKGNIVIKEVFSDGRITIKGLDPAPVQVNSFKGTDKDKWKSNIPSYGRVSMGEVSKGITLELKAYGYNIEKLFTVLPESNPESMSVNLEGGKKLRVNISLESRYIPELGEVWSDDEPAMPTPNVADAEILEAQLRQLECLQQYALAVCYGGAPTVMRWRRVGEHAMAHALEQAEFLLYESLKRRA